MSRGSGAVLVADAMNDSSMEQDPGTAYEDAYVAFLRTVREKNPAAWIGSVRRARRTPDSS